MANGEDPEDIKKRTEATEENTEASNENTEAVNENSEALKDQAAAAEAAAATQKALAEAGSVSRKQMQDIVDVLRDQLSAFEGAGDETARYAALTRSLASSQVELAKARAEGNTVLEKTLEAQIESIKADREQLEAGELLSNAVKETAKNYLEQNEVLLDNTERSRRATIAIQRMTDSEEKLGLVMNSVTATLSAAGAAELDFTAGGFAMLGSLIEKGKKFDEVSKKIQVQTGLSERIVDVQRNLVTSNSELGISTEEASKAITALSTGFSGFVAMDDAAQEQLADTVLTMERLGVASEASAKAADILNRSMGVQADAINDSLEGFDQLAQKLRLPTGQVVEDFGKLGPKLARFGKAGVAEFEKLATKAREIGIGVEEAFSIGEAFDTFEGAADLAGKLNAQLGLQINSVEMLGKTHAERVALLQQEFKQSGQNFDQLDRRQKQAVAEMMGVDVDMASKLFGDPIAYQQYQKDQEEAAARAERLTTIQQKLAVVGDKLIQAFGPFFTFFASIASVLAMGPMPQLISVLTMLVGTIVTYQKVKAALIAVEVFGTAKSKAALAVDLSRNAATKVGNALSATKTALMNKEIIADSVSNAKKRIGNGLSKVASFFKTKEIVETTTIIPLKVAEGKAEDVRTKAKIRGATATAIMGKVAAMSAIQMLALGFAIMMVGAGIGLAAFGMSYFVKAFENMSPAQILAVSVALLVFGATLIGFTLAMGKLILTGLLPATVGGLAALGAAAIGIGLGMGVAAIGLGMFVEKMQMIRPEVILASAAALGVMAGSIYLLTLSLNTLMLSLTAIALALANPFGAAGLGTAAAVLGTALAAIGAGALILTVGRGGLEALTETIEVGTQVSADGLENFTQISGRIVDMGVASTTANVPALNAMADAMTSGGTDGQEKTIELKINDRVLGEVIVNIMKEKYDLTPR